MSPRAQLVLYLYGKLTSSALLLKVVIVIFFLLQVMINCVKMMRTDNISQNENVRFFCGILYI